MDSGEAVTATVIAVVALLVALLGGFSAGRSSIRDNCENYGAFVVQEDGRDIRYKCSREPR